MQLGVPTAHEEEDEEDAHPHSPNPGTGEQRSTTPHGPRIVELRGHPRVFKQAKMSVQISTPPPAASSSSRPNAAAAAAHAVGLPHIGRGIAETRNVFDPDTQIGVGIDPCVTQAVSADSGVERSGQLVADKLARWKLTKGQDAVWEVYLDPKWARQRLRLYGAQDRALEQFFNKLEKDMAEVFMERHGHAKHLVVFFGAAGIGTGGGSAVNGKQPCKEELDHDQPTRRAGWKPPTGQVDLRLLRPAWSQQRDQPVRGLMWCPVVAPRKPPQAPRSGQEATPAAASEPGPNTPPSAKRSKRTKAEQAAEPTQPTKAKAKPAPQPSSAEHAAYWGEQVASTGAVLLEDQGALPAKGKEYPGLGYKRLRDKPPMAQEQQQQQQPAPSWHVLCAMPEMRTRTQPVATEFAVLRKRYSPADLAFMGDAVWTLHVRQKHLLPPKHISSYRASADQQVTADTQHALCDLLLEWGQSHLAPGPGQEPTAPAAAPKAPGPAIQQAVAPPPPGSPAAHYPLGGPPAALIEPCVGGGKDGPEAEVEERPTCCCFSPSQAELQLLHWAVQQQAGDERQRFKGSASRMASYRKATAFEALLGGLLLTQPGRLAQLLTCLPAA
ncbi:hypothetical protein QJQ45_024129 [Haematococcus lacustris]|nr:hypothetical protein QJQ45_024129 [Haematococcus lacustris]